MTQIIAEQPPAMFVIVTVNAEVFPVGTIRRIIGRITIFVMDGEEMPVSVLKLSSALRTDEPMNL